jgi:hypothetical protein
MTEASCRTRFASFSKLSTLLDTTPCIVGEIPDSLIDLVSLHPPLARTKASDSIKELIILM